MKLLKWLKSKPQPKYEYWVWYNGVPDGASGNVVIPADNVILAASWLAICEPGHRTLNRFLPVWRVLSVHKYEVTDE